MEIEDETLRQALADRQTVTPTGSSTASMIDGVTFRDIVTHADERGSVAEIFDPRRNWHTDPVLFV